MAGGMWYNPNKTNVKMFHIHHRHSFHAQYQGTNVREKHVAGGFSSHGSLCAKINDVAHDGRLHHTRAAGAARVQFVVFVPVRQGQGRSGQTHLCGFVGEFNRFAFGRFQNAKSRFHHKGWIDLGRDRGGADVGIEQGHVAVSNSSFNHMPKIQRAAAPLSKHRKIEFNT
jgi:hypothetical protein